MTITEFLLARIGEDEAVARAGISGQADPENGWGYGGYGSPKALTPHVGIIHEAAQAEHIIRWHPARVLAECEAKRRIVALHREWENFGDCATCGDVPQFEFPCDTIKAVASVYADHPDFNPAWS